jgi:hypothetical protein
MDLEYVLPLKISGGSGGVPPGMDTAPAGADHDELTDYLCRISGWLDVTVVDGSDPTAYAENHERWSGFVRHLPPDHWPGRNGKVAGVVTGVRRARHEFVVIADDDVRWDGASLEQAAALLGHADLVRPQNVFDPLPWHARWDTARSLLNRAFGADYPGTYLLRRSTFLKMGGYDGDTMFENLEMSRTLRVAGGRELWAPSIFVRRRPPTARHFVGQRVRQAYDDFAQPTRLLVEAAVLPLLLGLVRAASRGRVRLAAAGLISLLSASLVLAERGRRAHGGAAHFPATAALWAPGWILERAVCVWFAIGCRLTGGVPYGDQRLPYAAHSMRWLRRHADRRPALDQVPVFSRWGSATGLDSGDPR